MATKIQFTPTTNLFALLDEPGSQPARKKAEPANSAAKGATKELTPAARAAIKAEEEKRKKEAADKARKATATTELVNPADLEGFGLQRNQRVKEKRLAPQEAPKETGKFNRGDKKPFRSNKNFSGEKDENRPFKDSNRGPKGPGLRADKPQREGYNAPKDGNNEGRPARRDYDKHSQGKYSKQPYAKKQGHGKGNWGDESDLAAVPAPETPATMEPTVAVVDEVPGTDEWGVAPVVDENQAPVESEAPVEEVAAEPEVTELDYDEYLQLKAQKQKELEARVGATRDGPRELSADEKKNLQKFTMVENTKAVVVNNREVKIPKEVAPVARKGEKAVSVDEVFSVSLPAINRGEGRGEGRGGRGRGGRGRGGEGRGNRGPGDKRDDNRAPRGPKNTGGRGGNNRAAQKIVKSETQFPSLG